MGDKRSLGRFVASFPIRANSDYYPVLDLNAGRARFLGETSMGLLELDHLPFPTLELLSRATPPWQRTDIASSPAFQPSQAAYAATVLRDFFLHGSFPSSRPEKIPEEVRMQALWVKELFSQRNSPEEQKKRLGSLFATAIVMVPYLTPAELGDVWKALEAGPGAPALAGPARQCVTLFEAISRRNGADMAAAAQALLNGNYAFSTNAMRYIVAAGMAGCLMEGDKGASLRLWSRYRPVLFVNGEPDLQFRLLAAESGA